MYLGIMTINFAMSDFLLEFHVSPLERLNESTVQFAVLTSEVLDYESGPSNLTFSVTATDGSLTHSAAVRIHVLDINDNSPVFSQTSFTAIVKENMGGHCVLQVTMNTR